jgi:hypothetical protein
MSSNVVRGCVAFSVLWLASSVSAQQTAPRLSTGTYAWGDVDGLRGPDGVVFLAIDPEGVEVELSFGPPGLVPEEEVEAALQADGSVVITRPSDASLRIVIRRTPTGLAASGCRADPPDARCRSSRGTRSTTSWRSSSTTGPTTASEAAGLARRSASCCV